MLRQLRASAALLVGGLTLTVAFFVSRSLFLDRDLPPWAVSWYQPIDEFYYTIPGFNLYHFGAWEHSVLPYVPSATTAVNVLQNLVTWLTLALWGNTYYGLRMASVLFMFATFAFTLLTVVRMSSRPAYSERGPLAGVWAAGFFGVVMLADFASLLAGRVAEPTASRMLAFSALVCLLSGEWFFREATRHWERTALLGVLTMTCVVWVYVYNAFMLPAVLLAVVLWARREGRIAALLQALAFSLGALLSLGAWLGAIYVVYQKNPMQAYSAWTAGLGSTTRYAGPTWHNVHAILSTNAFRSDRLLMLVFLLALPVFVLGVVRTRDRFGSLVVLLTGFFLLQTAFVNDYSYRKLVMLVPFVIILAAGAWFQAPSFLVWLRGSKRRMNSAVAYVGAALAVVLLETMRTSLPRGGSAVPGPVVLIIVLCLAVGSVSLGFLLSARSQARTIIATIVLLAALVVPGATLAVTYVYGHPTFGYRDAMTSAAPRVDGRIVAGHWSYAMRLYNTSTPVFNSYRWNDENNAQYQSIMRQILARGDVTGAFAYSSGDDLEKMQALGLTLVQEYVVQPEAPRRMGLYVRNKSAP